MLLSEKSTYSQLTFSVIFSLQRLNHFSASKVEKKEGDRKAL